MQRDAADLFARLMDEDCQVPVPARHIGSTGATVSSMYRARTVSQSRAPASDHSTRRPKRKSPSSRMSSHQDFRWWRGQDLNLRPSGL